MKCLYILQVISGGRLSDLMIFWCFGFPLHYFLPSEIAITAKFPLACRLQVPFILARWNIRCQWFKFSRWRFRSLPQGSLLQKSRKQIRLPTYRAEHQIIHKSWFSFQKPQKGGGFLCGAVSQSWPSLHKMKHAWQFQYRVNSLKYCCNGWLGMLRVV